MPLILARPMLISEHSLIYHICRRRYGRFDSFLYADEAKESDSETTFDDTRQNRARSIKVLKHFSDDPHLNELKSYIPSKHFFLKRRSSLKHLYLLDKQVAHNVVSYILPFLPKHKEHVVCDTNTGLGLIAAELLDRGIKSVRVYESCSEFREKLKDFDHTFPGRVQLFYTDLFDLGLVSSIDKHTYGNRVEELLRDIPKRTWNDDPPMTIIGPMPTTSFIHYLMKMLALQQEIIKHGRTQIFTLMKPRDYIKLTANPSMNLHVYQASSILFQLFFDSELLEKYPRKSFLPWETKMKIGPHTHAHARIDLDCIYLVRINFKTVLPTKPQHLLHLYYFVKQGFLRGKPRVIPTMEKWMPGIGVNLIVPKGYRSGCFRNMDIYTEFGQLKPTQILNLFLEMLEQPQYENSPFVAIVESQLLKSETIDSELAEKPTADTSSDVKNVKDNVR